MNSKDVLNRVLSDLRSVADGYHGADVMDSVDIRYGLLRQCVEEGLKALAALSAPTDEVMDPRPVSSANPWIYVDGNNLIISRFKWTYPDSTDQDAGDRDEIRYTSIGRRDGDIVLSFDGTYTDAKDADVILSTTPMLTPPPRK